jgi:competence protein ComEA
LHPRYVRAVLSIVVVIFCLVLAGCYACGVKQNPDELKEKTARATAALKSDAKAVAQGVREGWSRDKPLDINHATSEQLTTLPGIGGPEAQRIVANRPYKSPQDLVTKRVMSRAEFDRLKDRLTAKP